MKNFDLSTNIDSETNIDGSFSLFGFIKGSGQDFAGHAEELHYTEMIFDGVEYQVGYGYVLQARQRDAKPTANGPIGSVAVNSNLDFGRTSFSASVIGLAPQEDPGCDAGKTAPDEALVCQLDLNPTVSQAFFIKARGNLSAALAKWPTPPPGADLPKICPQVINYRAAPSQAPGTALNSGSVQAGLATIQAALESICPDNLRPNAHISYKNGPAARLSSASVGVGGGSASISQTMLTQSYYRSRVYLADTNRRNPATDYKTSDKLSEVYITSLTGAASTPSLLAAVITLNASVSQQNIHVFTQCAGGSGPVQLGAFTAAATDAVKSAIAYGQFTAALRAAVDSAEGACPPTPPSESGSQASAPQPPAKAAPPPAPIPPAGPRQVPAATPLATQITPSKSTAPQPLGQAADVAVLQLALWRHGQRGIAIDGTLGPSTKAAIKRFQISQTPPLPATGDADPITRTRLGLPAAVPVAAPAEIAPQAEIRQVQRALRKQKFLVFAAPNQKITGVFDPATIADIVVFQDETAGLVVTGRLDALTLAKLGVAPQH